MEIPIKKDNSYDIEIIDLNHLGKGVGKVEGFTVFAEGGIPGDVGKVKINKIKKNFALGKMEDIYTPSLNRITPPCPIAHICGGCQIQELKYQQQLNIKKRLVENNIQKIGGLEDVKIHDVIGMESPFRYRNKSQLPVGKKDNDLAIGFYKMGTHEIIDTKECLIQHENSDKIIEIVRNYMKDYNIMPYNERTGKGIIRHIVSRVSFRTGDTMVGIVTNKEKIPYEKALIDSLVMEVPNIKSIVQNINTRKTNVILGNKNRLLYGEDTIVDYIENLKFKISLKSFLQVNPKQTEVLYKKALEYCDLNGDETVFDLYSGAGTISLFLAQRAKMVYGIEIVEQAVKDAKENAKLNNIDNVQFYAGKSEDIFPKLYNDGVIADVVVVDPPRKGCDEKVLETIVDMNPKKIVYVSCNPSTLARDLKYLDERGYKAEEIQPVDMFSHTMHIECVVGIQKIQQQN